MTLKNLEIFVGKRSEFLNNSQYSPPLKAHFTEAEKEHVLHAIENAPWPSLKKFSNHWHLPYIEVGFLRNKHAKQLSEVSISFPSIVDFTQKNQKTVLDFFVECLEFNKMLEVLVVHEVDPFKISAYESDYSFPSYIASDKLKAFLKDLLPSLKKSQLRRLVLGFSSTSMLSQSAMGSSLSGKYTAPGYKVRVGGGSLKEIFRGEDVFRVRAADICLTLDDEAKEK